MPSPMIETRDLTKIYGDIIAVNNLNLSVEEGEVYGFLGPNGSGKTTTILMLLGLTEPTGGEARIAGFHVTKEGIKVRKIAGYLPENVGFYEDLTARRNLRYIAMLNSIPRDDAEERIENVLDIVGLKNVADKPVAEFSKGMKQRLGIADVLIKEPKVVFLDEPTAGVDPEGVKRILDAIGTLSKEKRLTIMLSSHLLYQVQRICDKVGILSNGKMVAQGSIEELGKEALGPGFKVVIDVDQPSPLVADKMKGLEGVESVEQSGESFLVTCTKDVRPELAKSVISSGAALMQMKALEYGLDEIYIKYFREGA